MSRSSAGRLGAPGAQNSQGRLDDEAGRQRAGEWELLAEPASNATVVDAVAEHEAVQAWRRLGVGGHAPARVETLKAAGRKSAVYRLVAAGPSAENVVAKRCSTTTAVVEYAVYRIVLPRLPISRLECYGLGEAGTPGLSWLFVEDGRGQPFRAGEETHRVVAARWMAALHLAADERMLAGLPDRTLAYHRGVLEAAMSALAGAAGNPHLDREDLATVSRARRACGTLARHWTDLAAICDLLPETLVHGGFGRKNVHVRAGADGPELVPFDWEAAGRGMPAADLARVDVDTYAAAVARHSPRMSLQAAQDVATVGRALWCVSSIPGEAGNLAAPWAVRTMPKIVAYVDELETVLAALRWRGGGHDS